MICEECLNNRDDKDFISNQKICYKCIYNNKLNKSKKNKKEVNKCRICGNKIIYDESIKQRHRTTFCSEQCAIQGHKDHCKNYWTRKLKAEVPLYPI